MLFKCVTYQLDKNVILTKLQGHRLCGILHNMDDGKKDHIHFIIEHERISPIKLHYKLTEILGELTLCKTVFKFNEDYDYFTHKHNRTKYHYESEDIFTNADEFFRDLYTRADYTLDNDLITDLQNPNISFRTLAEVYGLDFVKNLRTYVFFRELCMRDDAEYRRNEEIKKRIKEQEERINRDIEREKQILCDSAPFPLSFEDISLKDDGGQYTYAEYMSCFDWYRAFYRHQTPVVKAWLFDMLPATVKFKVERLIHVRKQRGEIVSVETVRTIPTEYASIFQMANI